VYKKLQKSYDEKNSELLVTEKILISDEETVGFYFHLRKTCRANKQYF